MAMIKKTIPFMAIRNIAFGITLVLTVIGLGALLTRGWNFGRDCTGGTPIEPQYEEAAELALIKRELGQAGHTDAVVQSFCAVTDALVPMAGDHPEVGTQAAQALRKIDTDARFQ